MKKKIFFLLLFLFFLHYIKGQSVSIDTMLLCDKFVKSYQSTTLLGNDTLAVSRTTQPESIVNNFLLNCAKHKDFRPVKYAFAVIYKQNREYSQKYKSDYVIYESSGDNLYKNNGIVAIILAFINVYEPYKDEEVVFFTNNIYLLMVKHRKKIIDYQYLKKYLK